ncbi:hypothetical protein DPMN_110446 [Dreissena polymorpha]|uniref:Uncharacterized protein n=3 Tax=Dreissena polymorpha TaxID=45954 RepID=A0A9D4KC39_DREPO|nr:hypothetical protein DPMN_110446 [Dreissena polymorpha]
MPMSMSLPSASLYASVCKTPRSPDISRTVVSSTVPTCKVTPLVSTSPGGGEELEGAVGGCISDSNSLGSMSEMIDWITSDPELLEHCRSSSPPVLRNSQYWV